MTTQINFRFKSLLNIISLTLVLLLNACTNDDNNTADVPPADTTRTTGFVIVGITASGSSLIKYVEELPTEAIDLSDGTDFSAFVTRAIYEGALFLRRPDHSDCWSKNVVYAGGALEEVGFIATIDLNPFLLCVRDA
ncbi:MAG: hypothetical protein ACFB0B_05990, partial [Thermonemataceae bacterium]